MLKPFELEKALSGVKVVTRDGREIVRIIHIPEAAESHRVVAVSKGGDTRLLWEDGRYYKTPGDTSPHDLFLSVPEPREVKTTMWMNVPDSLEPPRVGDEFIAYLYTSKDSAMAVGRYTQYKSIAEEVTVIRKVED